MRTLRVISTFAPLTLAATAFGASVDVHFLGGTAHDPDGAGFGHAAAQTGFFQLTIASGGAGLISGESFHSFRLDLTPSMNEGMHGFVVGNSVAPNGDLALSPAPLATQVAFLYTQFRTGTLAGFDAGAAADIDALQDAIWHFQGLIGQSENRRADPTALPGDEGAYQLSARASAFVDAANAAVQNGSWSGLGHVRVLTATIMGDDEGASQGNYLAYVVVPTVPLPGQVGLAAGGLLLAGARRRRPI